MVDSPRSNATANKLIDQSNSDHTCLAIRLSRRFVLEGLAHDHPRRLPESVAGMLNRHSTTASFCRDFRDCLKLRPTGNSSPPHSHSRRPESPLRAAVGGSLGPLLPSSRPIDGDGRPGRRSGLRDETGRQLGSVGGHDRDTAAQRNRAPQSVQAEQVPSKAQKRYGARSPKRGVPDSAIVRNLDGQT